MRDILRGGRHRNVPPAIIAFAMAAAALSGCAGGGGALPTGSPASAHRRLTPSITRLSSQPPEAVQFAFLMTDGSVLAQAGASSSTNRWYKYVPDSSGNYSDGAWTQVAGLPAGYSPIYYASGVLADGRLLISGGEYNFPSNGYFLQLTNLGAIYDPVKNTWTPLGHPHRWGHIGDSPSSVLPNGLFFIGEKLTTQAATYDPATAKWMLYKHTNKADFNAEEGFTLLPDGSVLTADVKNAPNSELFDPKTHSWSSAGSTIVDLHSPTTFSSCLRYGKPKRDCYNPPGEIGPALLRPDGTVFATGSFSGTSGPGHTAIYTPSKSQSGVGTWKAGPDFPNGDNAGDSYAVLVPSGDMIVFGVSGELYDWNGSTLSSLGASWSGTPLLLPTGQILMLGSTLALYNPTGTPKASWAPTIATVSKRLAPGHTYTISGTQFNGLSQAMAYGDENQNATNYPLVRITNNATHHVFYARTHDHSSMGVQTGSLIVTTHFDVPATIDKGSSSLVVVANGIASKPVIVSVK